MENVAGNLPREPGARIGLQAWSLTGDTLYDMGDQCPQLSHFRIPEEIC
jgi:hypothetical protein